MSNPLTKVNHLPMWQVPPEDPDFLSHIKLNNGSDYATRYTPLASARDRKIHRWTCVGQRRPHATPAASRPSRRRPRRAPADAALSGITALSSCKTLVPALVSSLSGAWCSLVISGRRVYLNNEESAINNSQASEFARTPSCGPLRALSFVRESPSDLTISILKLCFFCNSKANFKE